jgi:hypothetical protein
MQDDNALLSSQSGYSMGVSVVGRPVLHGTCNTYLSEAATAPTEATTVNQSTSVNHSYSPTLPSRMESLNKCMDASFETRQHVLRIRKDFPKFLEQHPHLYSTYLEERTKLMMDAIQYRQSLCNSSRTNVPPLQDPTKNHVDNTHHDMEQQRPAIPSNRRASWVPTLSSTLPTMPPTQHSVTHQHSSSSSSVHYYKPMESNRTWNRSSLSHHHHGYHPPDQEQNVIVSRSDEENINPSSKVHHNKSTTHQYHHKKDTMKLLPITTTTATTTINNNTTTTTTNTTTDTSSFHDIPKFKKTDGGESIKSNQSYISEGNFSLSELTVAGFIAKKMDDAKEHSTKRSEGANSAFNYLLDICSSEVSFNSPKQNLKPGEQWNNIYASEFPLPESLNSDRYSAALRQKSQSSLKFSETPTFLSNRSSNDYDKHGSGCQDILQYHHTLNPSKHIPKRLSWKQDRRVDQHHNRDKQSCPTKSKFGKKTIRRRGPSVNSHNQDGKETTDAHACVAESITKSDSVKTLDVIKAVENIFENPFSTVSNMSSFVLSEDRWQPVRIMDGT